MKRICERAWEVEALQEGRLGEVDASSFERHRAICEECRHGFRENARLRELGQAVVWPKDDALQSRRLRALILRKAAAPEPATARWPRMAYLAAAAAVTIVIVLGILRLNRPTPPLAAPAAAIQMGTISASAGARWSRSVDGSIERVRLEHGSLLLLVRHRERDERFLVDLPDGQLEVRGTRFDVSVHDGRTQRVHVFEGTVQVRIDGSPESLLGANETWSAAPVASEPPASSGLSVATAAKAPAPSAARMADRDRSYEEAIDLYRAKHYDESAAGFRAFVVGHASAPEAEDAAFLEASSLARGGHADAAASSAEAFLARYPKSIHVRDAATLVVRSARARADCDKARRLVTQWLSRVPEEEQRTLLLPCSK